MSILTSAASPTLNPGSHSHRSDPHYSHRSHYDPLARSPTFASTSHARTRPRPPDQPQSRPRAHSRSPADPKTVSSEDKLASTVEPIILWKTPPRPRMVDAGTQYSPPVEAGLIATEKETPAPSVAKLRLADTEDSNNAVNNSNVVGPGSGRPSTPMTERQGVTAAFESPQGRGKRAAVEDPKIEDQQEDSVGTHSEGNPALGASKRLRPETPAIRLMPLKYETCSPHDLALIISSMLMELIRFNDAIPLRDGHLTRFHSRAPPGISVSDYLQRLTTHATLSPPILLSMVYYIDKLCALYPAFTINSLTVHRFLITSATVGSKGLSDSFWTNKVYARCGGVSLKELALLELEFLSRLEWRIVPKPEVLVDYYRSLIERTDGYELDVDEKLDEAAMIDTS